MPLCTRADSVAELLLEANCGRPYFTAIPQPHVLSVTHDTMKPDIGEHTKPAIEVITEDRIDSRIG